MSALHRVVQFLVINGCNAVLSGQRGVITVKLIGTEGLEGVESVEIIDWGLYQCILEANIVVFFLTTVCIAIVA